MATRQPAPPAVETLPEGWQAPLNGALAVQEPDEESTLDRLIALMSGAPEDKAFLKLYRKVPGDANGEFCDDISIHEYEARGPSYIREVYGPGSYIIWLYGPNPKTGKTGRLAHERFTIAPAPSRETGAVAVAQPQTETVQFLRAMMEQQQAQHAALMAALTNRPDSGAQMRETLALMGAMREAMGLNGPTVAVPAPAADPVQMMNTMLTTIRQMREVSDEINPPKESPIDPESPMALVGSILDLVKTAVANPGIMERMAPMLGGVQQNPHPANAPMLALPSSIASAQEPAHPGAEMQPLEPQPETMEQMVMKGALQGLVNMANENATAQAGGEYIADTLPDEVLPYLRLPNWFDLLARFGQSVGVDVAPHRAWIEAAKVVADQLLSAPDPD